MSQTLQNQIMLAKSMNGIISLSDGAGSTISGGVIQTNNVNTSTITANSLSVNDVNLNGSLEVPAVNDIPDGYTNLVSFLNNGKTTLLSDAWYYGVITNNYNLTNKLYVDSAISGLSALYASLSGTNVFTGFNSFNTNLPTSTLTPTNANDLTTKTYVDSNFINLTGTQTVTGGKTFTSTQQFTGYLIPRLGTTNSLRLGNQSQQYQVSTLTTAYNITFGANSLRGNATNPTWNKCKRNVVIGTNAGQSLTYDAGNDLLPSDDNVIIGDNALTGAFYNSAQNVIIGSKCAQYNVYVKNNVLIGYAVNSNANLNNLQNSVIIGASSGMGTQAGSVVCVGQGNNLLANSFTVCGSQNLQSATLGNRICILGSNNLNNISGADAFSCAVGNDNGNSQNGANSFYNVYVGFNNNCSANVNGSITFGISSTIPRSNIFYIGSNHNIGQLQTYQDLVLAKKNTLYCTTDTTAASYTLAFENSEILNITSSTTTTITLPTPTSSGDGRWNLGTRFTIIKSYSPYVAITINAPTGQTLRKVDGTTGSGYNFSAYESYITFVCVATSGTTWAIVNQMKTNSYLITYPNNSVPSTAISGTLGQSSILNGYVDLSTDQSIFGEKTFLTAPIMDGTGINTGTIGQTQIANGYVDLATDQTIDGVKVFTTPPVMSGASISANSIPVSAINANICTTDTDQTITGLKTLQSSGVAQSAIFKNTSTSNAVSIDNISQQTAGTQTIQSNNVYGLNNSSASVLYAQQQVYTTGTVAGAENSRISFYAMDNGTLTNSLSIFGNSINGNRPVLATNGFLKQMLSLALTANANYSAYTYYGATFNIVSSTGAYTLTIPSANISGYAVSVGNEIRVNNNSGQIITLSSVSNFQGNYASGTTTWQIAGYQNVELYSDGSNWYISRVSGTPILTSRYHNTTQSIPNITNTSVQFNTANTQTWLNAGLGYGLAGAEYRFTNNNSYTISISVNVAWSWASNATGMRRIYFSCSNAIYGLGAQAYGSSTPASASGTTDQTITGVFRLDTGDYFAVYVYQNSGGALSSATNPRNFIQITRL